MAALILLLGIGLMLFPQKKTEEVVQNQETLTEDTIEERLEQLLSEVEGAGKTRVILTLKEGISYTFQTNLELSTDDNGQEQQTETVLVSDGNGAEAPVIVSTKYPIYQGAVVLCQGADSAAVRLNIVNAVSDLTGLGADKISVIKMTGN